MRIRMRYWAIAFAAMTVAAVVPGRAAAQKTTEPTVEVRLRSVEDLFDKAEYIGELVDKGEPVKQARGLLKQLSADGKGIEGIDPKRPFGAYAVLNQDVASSPVVVMIPVADQDRLLAALKDRLQVVPEKADDGTMKANVPLINEVHLRFANGYLYLARDPKHIAAKAVITPKAFFAQDDGAVASATVRLDRIPADLKTFVIGQFEHQVQEGMKKDKANKSAAERKLVALVADVVVGASKMLVDDGKDLTVRLFVDAKADALSAEVVLTAKDGSALAKNIAGLSGKTSVPAGIVAGNTPAILGGAKVELTDDLKTRLDPVIDNLIDELVKKAKPDEREVVKRALGTLAPTFKAGHLDAAVAGVGPDAKGRYAVLGAVAVKDGKEIEKLVKDLAPMIPAGAVEFTFDVEKIGKFNLHKAEAKQTGDDFERIFGTSTIWIATSEDHIAFSIEPDGSLLKAGLKAKPGPAKVLTFEMGLAKAVPLFEKNLKPDEVKALIKDAFGGESPAGKDTLSVTVEGGNQLTARVKMKGKALRLATMLNEFKAK
ncbi:MAG: hypothetical protein JWO38_4588 [Gemmataceae bacterium]|nr:hypothetical protein [Gemmataceae bacterium]